MQFDNTFSEIENLSTDLRTYGLTDLFSCYHTPMFRSSFSGRKFPHSRGARIVIIILAIIIIIPMVIMGVLIASYYVKIQNGSAISPKQELLKQSIARTVANASVAQEDLEKLVPSEGLFPVLGSDDAPVTVVAFIDYRCPYTRDSMPAIRTVMENMGDRARLIIRDFPIPQLYPESRDVAHAARCVLDQGQKAYWRYQELLFAEQDAPSAETLRALVSKANLNVARFNDCMSARMYDVAIDTDVTLGERVGVAGTPTFFVNGAKFDGSVDEELFTKLVNHFLQ